MRNRVMLAAICLAALGLLSPGSAPRARAMPARAVIPGEGPSGAFVHPASAPLPQSGFEEGWEQYATYVGDVNGDGRDDLIWNKVRGAQNRIYVALVGSSGALTFLRAQDHPSSSWGYTQSQVGDVNADGRADLIWTTTTASVSRIYVALGKNDGTFTFLPAQDYDIGDSGDYAQLAGDINGDGRLDLIWNRPTGAQNRTYVALANRDGTFRFLEYQDAAPLTFTDYDIKVGDVNGDGNDDLVWSTYVADLDAIALSVAFGDSDGTLTFADPQDFSADVMAHDPRYGQTYSTLLADVNGDGVDDLVWAGRFYDDTSGSRDASGPGDIIVAFGTESGVFRPAKRYDQLFLGPNDRFPYGLTQIADTNGDRTGELITTAWDQYGETLVYLVVRNEDGDMLTLPFEDSPRIDTRATTMMTGDVTGDGRADLIWNKKFGPMNRLYIGRGNANSTLTFLPVQDHP